MSVGVEVTSADTEMFREAEAGTSSAKRLRRASLADGILDMMLVR